MAMYSTFHVAARNGPTMQIHHDSADHAMDHARHVLRTYPACESVVVLPNYGPFSGLTMTIRRASPAGPGLATYDVVAPDPAPVEPEPDHPGWSDRLMIDSEVSTDSPVIRGTWVTVARIVSCIVDGYTWSDIIRSHPEVAEDDIRAALSYAIEEDMRKDGAAEATTTTPMGGP